MGCDEYPICHGCPEFPCELVTCALGCDGCEYWFTKNCPKTKIFIICPVRDLTDGERLKIQSHIQYLEETEESLVYYPPRDTNQDDTIGLRICQDNFEAIKNSNEVHVFWNEKSKGSLFDLGMAFALNRTIKLMNCISPTEHKSFNNVLLTLDKLNESEVIM